MCIFRLTMFRLDPYVNLHLTLPTLRPLADLGLTPSLSTIAEEPAAASSSFMSLVDGNYPYEESVVSTDISSASTMVDMDIFSG